MMNSWVGSPEGAIIGRFGVPASTYQLENGDKVLSYHQASTFMLGGYTTTTPVTTNTSGVVGNTPYYGTTTTYVPQQQPATPVNLWCDLTLTISHGVLSSWSANGNNCVARAR